MKELKNIKNNFEVNHATRMEELNEELNKAIESSRKTQKSKPSETKNTKTLSKLNDLLASL